MDMQYVQVTVLTDDSYMQDCIQLQHYSSFNGLQVSFH